MNRSAWLGVCLSAWLWSFGAQAEPVGDATAATEAPTYPAQPEPYATDYVAQAAAPATFSLRTPPKYDVKVDLQLELPIPLTDLHDSAKTGGGMAAMFGWDLGFLLPTANIGWSWTPLNVPRTTHQSKSLTRFHMGLGVMSEFENRSIVVPVLGVMFDLNWWHITGDTFVACGGYYYWGCYQYRTYDFTAGFTFKAGLDFRFLPNDQFTLGVGALPSVSLSGGPFRQSEWWLSPYAAFTIRS